MSVMYLPKVDDDTVLIAKRLERLGHVTTGWYNGSNESTLAYFELLGMGKYIAGHLLNAWERPPVGSPKQFSLSVFYRELNKLLLAMIDRDDLTLDQLSRYRHFITSEKI